MSAPVKYRDSTTPEPYESALTPPDLSFEDYKALIEERTAAEERYEEAITRHDSWKTAKAKEARAEKLKQDKLARQLKVEALKKEKEEAERKAEEKRLEEERIRLEAEKEEALALEKEDKEREKEQEKEDEANELALQAAGVLLASDGDTEADPVDPKTAAMTELRRRRSIAKGKKRAETVEP